MSCMHRKNLEQWKEELVGKVFGRLTVIDVQPHIRKSTGKKDGFEVICVCTCGKQKIVTTNKLISGDTSSCGCLSVEKGLENLEKAHQWYRDHPDEKKVILEKCVQNMLNWQKEHPKEIMESRLRNIEQAQKWRKEHPEECKRIDQKRLDAAHRWYKEHKDDVKSILCSNIEKARAWRNTHKEEVKSTLEKARKQLKENRKKNPIKYTTVSKEEKDLHNYLISLDYNPEQQFLLEDHFFDFRINNFLIEYHGSIYHCLEYKNISNPTTKIPGIRFKDRDYHKELRELANRHVFHLIQVWDYDWIHRKEFIQKLLKDQLSGIANYKDYLDENNLLNNDYGFGIDGEQVEPKALWISTGYRQIVDGEYQKGKVLVYNSGYTKIKE